MLELENVHSYYGAAHILHGLSLQVAQGQAVALLGRNGAGKSTTLKTIAGLVQARQGRIRFKSHDLHGRAPHHICRFGIGYVPEERRIFTTLTVEENLEVGRRPPRSGAPQWSIDQLYSLFPNLAERRYNLGGQLSGGEQQMLTIARTLMGNPEFILLDEPSEGLAPIIVEQMAEAIATLKKQGLTILLSEQNLHFAERIAEQVYIIEKGTICFQGHMADLMEDAITRDTYLMV